MSELNQQTSSLGNKKQEPKPYNYIDIPNNLHAELYPRKRRTELYFEPSPQFEYQTREAEHPKKALEIFMSSLSKSTGNRNVGNSSISPPTCSTTRIARDSYFS